MFVLGLGSTEALFLFLTAYAAVRQPFPIQEGSGEIRNGTVTFTNLRQRPTIRTRTNVVHQGGTETVHCLV
jgi:hypothetical protein